MPRSFVHNTHLLQPSACQGKAHAGDGSAEKTHLCKKARCVFVILAQLSLGSTA